MTADFGTEAANETISGVVENFMSGDTSMDWRIALGATILSATGGIDAASDTSGDTADNAVVWTIGGVDGAKAGAWSRKE